MLREPINGANAIVLDGEGKILMVRHSYGKKQWALPGGGIERGEAPSHGAQEETEEETGIIIDAGELRLIAYFVQRPKGIVFLFEATRFSGNLITEPNDEVLESRFMSFDEILKMESEVGLGYRRMIVRYRRCSLCIDKIPYEGRLSDKVEYPKTPGVDYSNVMFVI